MLQIGSTVVFRSVHAHPSASVRTRSSYKGRGAEINSSWHSRSAHGFNGSGIFVPSGVGGRELLCRSSTVF